ncbi:UxaA family hydrolase [Asticcacaulis sp. AND118]|uniref:UxaA family hydrolase n=1 Tax=Asticcacaulis sp. AND118 TaxID=2840468 RepID=UPI001CFF66D0|nr:UxaA family hydrolase [Asticcacaulis sp. AND118]UDF03095.1 UxaA family hydrolase [Asticcacaulis sp. AND118]
MSLPSPLILLHPDDNVAVCRQAIAPGTDVPVAGDLLSVREPIEVGHKVAVRDLKAGDKIFKYGAPIGSMIRDTPKGGHVHMHNMKSDYISSHTREASGGTHA